jgi:hypothetical protein
VAGVCTQTPESCQVTRAPALVDVAGVCTQPRNLADAQRLGNPSTHA